MVPVNFVLTGGRVHIRTAAYSALARECDDSLVAFEVDEFDADSRSGWSVLMRGRAHLASGARRRRPSRTSGPPEPAACSVTVDVEEISGRRVA